MGGSVATVAEFLELSEAEAAVVELRLELAGAVRLVRALTALGAKPRLKVA